MQTGQQVVNGQLFLHLASSTFSIPIACLFSHGNHIPYFIWEHFHSKFRLLYHSLLYLLDARNNMAAKYRKQLQRKSRMAHISFLKGKEENELTVMSKRKKSEYPQQK